MKCPRCGSIPAAKCCNTTCGYLGPLSHFKPDSPVNTLSTGFEVKINFHTDTAHDKIKSETFVREKIGAIFDTHGVQEEIDYTLEVRRLYE